MVWVQRGALALVIFVTGVQPSFAQSLPKLVRNLPQVQETEMREALVERVRRTYPSDIRSTMLSTLLRMEGFEISETDTGVAATIREAAYPCVTQYTVMWDETERGKTENLRATLKRKCV